MRLPSLLLCLFFSIGLSAQVEVPCHFLKSELPLFVHSPKQGAVALSAGANIDGPAFNFSLMQSFGGKVYLLGGLSYFYRPSGKPMGHSFLVDGSGVSADLGLGLSLNKDGDSDWDLDLLFSLNQNWMFSQAYGPSEINMDYEEFLHLNTHAYKVGLFTSKSSQKVNFIAGLQLGLIRVLYRKQGPEDLLLSGASPTGHAIFVQPTIALRVGLSDNINWITQANLHAEIIEFGNLNSGAFYLGTGLQYNWF